MYATKRQEGEPTVRVTVAWITPTEQELVSLELPAGTTVASAIAASKLASSYTLSLHVARVGINGVWRGSTAR